VLLIELLFAFVEQPFARVEQPFALVGASLALLGDLLALLGDALTLVGDAIPFVRPARPRLRLLRRLLGALTVQTHGHTNARTTGFARSTGERDEFGLRLLPTVRDAAGAAWRAAGASAWGLDGVPDDVHRQLPDEVVDELLAGARTEQGIVGWRAFARTSG
jgi:hypothetical protein